MDYPARTTPGVARQHFSCALFRRHGHISHHYYTSLAKGTGKDYSAGAEVVLYFAQLKLLSMQPSLHPQLWLIGIVSGVLVITVLGLLRSREIITVPPLQSLRQIG